MNENAKLGIRYAWRDPQPDDGSLHGDFWLAPGRYGAPDHINPLFTEHVTVVSGTAEFRLAKRRWRAGPGERAVLPLGVPHNFRNAGTDELQAEVEIRPATNYRAFLDAAFERGGPTTSRGLPLNPLRMAVIQQRYPDAIYLATVPVGLQRIVTNVLAPLGRLAGYKA